MPSIRRPLSPQPARDTPPRVEQQRQDEAMQDPDHPQPHLPRHTVFVRTCLTPLLTTTEPYLSDEYVHKFGIRRRQLDIFSGLAMRPGTQQPDPRSTAFMRPMALDDVRSATEINRPWISPIYGSPHRLSWDKNIDNWWQAYWIGEHFSMYARDNKDEWKPGLIDSTAWQAMSIPAEYKLYQQDALDMPTVKWEAANGWISDTPKPHVVCTLSDIVPLRDGEVSVAEMRTILTLSGARARDEGHWNQRVIPVTIISGSGKQFRVVMGIVDSRDGHWSVEVRTSSIIDVSEGEQDGELRHRNNWIAVLALMLGQPVGVPI